MSRSRSPSLVVLPLAGLAALLAINLLIASEMACDDTCSPASSQWRQRADAWQWDALKAAALCALLGAIASCALLASRAGRPIAVVLSLTWVCLTAPWIWLRLTDV